MKQAARAAALYDFEVTHPIFGTLQVSSIARDSATLEAARRWGVDWTAAVAEMDVKKGGKTQAPRCKKCGSTFGSAGTIGIYCADCLRMMELHRKQLAEIKGRDRRAGYR